MSPKESDLVGHRNTRNFLYFDVFKMPRQCKNTTGELEGMTVAQLRQRAVAAKVPKYGSMVKAELVKALQRANGHKEGAAIAKTARATAPVATERRRCAPRGNGGGARCGRLGQGFPL
jgi:hypothetical protein